MIKFTFVFILFLSVSSKAQIVNTISADKSNIYFHALDSIIRMLKISESYKRVTVASERSIMQHFPNKVDGLELVKLTDDLKKVPKIKKDEARFVVKSIEIIRDQFKIAILTWSHEGRIGDGLYVFRYKYVPETMTYELQEIIIGISL